MPLMIFWEAFLSTTTNNVSQYFTIMWLCYSGDLKGLNKTSVADPPFLQKIVIGKIKKVVNISAGRLGSCFKSFKCLFHV